MIRVPTPIRLTVASAGLVLALALVLGACSGSGSGSDGGASASPSVSGGTTAPGGAGATTGPGAPPSAAATPAPPADTSKPSVAISSAPPVKVGQVAALTPGVRVTVSRVRSVKVKANGPGDIAGAGVSVGLTVKNESKRSFDLGGLSVTASYGSTDKPAIPGGLQNGDPLTGSLRVGRTATGEYVFNVPAAQARSLQVQVSSNASPIILVFER
jgi:hypothetical protein